MTLTTVNFASYWVYLIGYELAIVLVIVCLILFAYGRSLRRLIGALEDRVVALRESMRKKNLLFNTLKGELESLRHQVRHGYSDALEQQLDATRNRHASLSPDRDIVLDITADTPLDRQALALRHAFLIAEKEAVIAADGKGVDWDILQAKLTRIIQFYGTPELPPGDGVLDEGFELDVPLEIDTDDGGQSGDATLDNLKRQIENLEKFRRLYFDAEKKWRDARAEAGRYRQELLALGESLGGGEQFNELLRSYVDVYGDIDKVLQAEAENGGEAPGASVSVGKIVITNQEEIQRLRNMAVDQHKLIVELKRQLAGAESEEDKECLFAEMQNQLERSERYLKESDNCVRQLETEISRLAQENDDLQKRAKAGGADPKVMEELDMARNLIASFTEQSRDMLSAIAALEEDNRKLAEAGSAGGDSGRAAELTAKLDKAQQELLDLQTQYIELEERYLELKMQSE
jgi:Sec-independent protein translocase protein TatA